MILRNLLSTLRHYKLASFLNILGLSVAFAAFILIMMRVNFERSFDKFHTYADRIYRLETTFPEDGDGMYTSGYARPAAALIQPSSAYIEKVGILRGGYQIRMFAEENGERKLTTEPMAMIDLNFPEIFDFKMVEGSVSSMEDESTVLLPQSMAKKLFGKESAIGQRLTTAPDYTTPTGKNTLVVGGVYRDFPNYSQIGNDIYINIGNLDMNSHGSMNYDVYVLLTDPAARPEVEAVIETLKLNNFKEEESRLNLLSDVYFSKDVARDQAKKGNKTNTDILFVIAFLIIVIAGINFVNFSTALAPVRIRGLNTRLILGENVGKLRTAMVFEAVAISVISFFLSLGITTLVLETSTGGLFDTENMSLAGNMGLLFFTALLAILTGFAAGVYPAYYSTSFSPALVIKGSFGLSPRGRALRMVLIGFQFTISMALIICALFMNIQHSYLTKRNIGIEYDNVLMTRMSRKLYTDSRPAFIQRLREHAAISDVAIADAPLFTNQYQHWMIGYDGKQFEMNVLLVNSSFPQVMKLDILEGRNFSAEDDAGDIYSKAIINQMAQKKYGFEVGHRMPINGGVEIIGVSEDANFESLHKEVEPMILMILGNSESSIRSTTTAYIRINSGEIAELIAYVSGIVAELDPNAIVDVKLLDENMQAQYESEKRIGSLITLFSLLTVLISLVGVFGLVVFENQYRIKEIGIRKINGATVAEILAMFNRNFIIILLICFALSVPVSYYFLQKWLTGFAYRTPLHWWVFPLSLLIVLLVTVGTVTFQSYRTAVENPAKTLKTE